MRLFGLTAELEGWIKWFARETDGVERVKKEICRGITGELGRVELKWSAWFVGKLQPEEVW